MAAHFFAFFEKIFCKIAKKSRKNSRGQKILREFKKLWLKTRKSQEGIVGGPLERKIKKFFVKWQKIGQGIVEGVNCDEILKNIKFYFVKLQKKSAVK